MCSCISMLNIIFKGIVCCNSWSTNLCILFTFLGMGLDILNNLTGNPIALSRHYPNYVISLELPWHRTKLMYFTYQFILFHMHTTSSVAEWLERSLSVWEARVWFPAESIQKFQIGSWSSFVKRSTYKG